MSNRTRQKNKRADKKMESDDSPEIPDRGGHQKSPASLKRKRTLVVDFTWDK